MITFPANHYYQQVLLTEDQHVNALDGVVVYRGGHC